MNGWHLIEEKAPERGQRIVVIRSDGRPFAGEYCDMPGYGRCIDRATGRFHYGWDLWMPLPSNDTPASTGAEPTVKESLTAQSVPVAYLHTVVGDDGEEDAALSFSIETFPLEGVAGYRSMRCDPLYAQPPSQDEAANLQSLLVDIARVNRDVPDAIDNDGEAYQSAALDAAIRVALAQRGE